MSRFQTITAAIIVLLASTFFFFKLHRVEAVGKTTDEPRQRRITILSQPSLTMIVNASDGFLYVDGIASLYHGGWDCLYTPYLKVTTLKGEEVWADDYSPFMVSRGTMEFRTFHQQLKMSPDWYGVELGFVELGSGTVINEPRVIQVK